MTIDPTLVYSTFLGGSLDDGAQALAVDLTGHAYVGGYTASADFPVSNAHQDVSGGANDAFVTKLDLSGTSVVYSTYVGGVDHDVVKALAVDADGNVYAGGDTASPDFPLANAYQSSLGGSTDAFLLKLDASGAGLSFSTYLGGWRRIPSTTSPWARVGMFPSPAWRARGSLRSGRGTGATTPVRRPSSRGSIPAGGRRSPWASRGAGPTATRPPPLASAWPSMLPATRG